MKNESLWSFLEKWAGRDRMRRDIAATVNALADAGRDIAALVSDGPLAGELAAAVTENVQGEVQKFLDLHSNDLLVDACKRAPVAAIASEELDHPIAIHDDGTLLVAVDPLDGSSNIDTNVSIGTIFSVLPAPDHVDASTHDAFLQKGRAQLAAGYILYGPQTTLVMTVGEGTQMFTLDRRRGTFILTNPAMQIPERTREFAINSSNQRHWNAPTKRYIEECIHGRDGARGEDTNMRWVGSLVADGHRILVRGGVYLYPADKRKGYQEGRLRLVYESNPIGWVVEQAGGAVSTGNENILDLEPSILHQRVPLVFGSKLEVQRIESHHILDEDEVVSAAE
jgi:fructose-1,6-bisphosphatase I